MNNKKYLNLISCYSEISKLNLLYSLYIYIYICACVCVCVYVCVHISCNRKIFFIFACGYNGMKIKLNIGNLNDYET